MKKEEAKMLAVDKSRVVIEYLEKILNDSEKVKGKMIFNWAKIENQDMCTLDIYVPKRNFERHLNMGITIDQSDVFYEQLFNDILNTFLERDDMGASRYYEIKGMMGHNFSGITAVKETGSEINLNFVLRGNEFKKIVSMYNNRINEYLERKNTQKEHEIKSKLR